MKFYISEDKNIRLINEDCLQVVDEMIERGVVVDCIITDPPYKLTSGGNTGSTGGIFKTNLGKKGKVFKENDLSPKQFFKRLYDISSEDAHIYVMVNNFNLIEFLDEGVKSGLTFVKSIIWNKGNKIMGRLYMGQYEHILFFRKPKFKRINNCGTSDILEVKNKKTKLQGEFIHPSEKPVELMEILIENSTKEGELVLDFTMGSGTTGLACKNLNRKFIGIELDEEYFNVAVKRLKGEL